MNENAGPYAGQDRFEARKGIVAQLEAEGLLRQDDAAHRAARPLPALRDGRRAAAVAQWFVKMAPLAEPAIRRGGGRAHPLRARELEQDLLRVDAQHPRLVHQRASSGGATASRPGPARAATRSIGRARGARRPARSAAGTSSRRRRTSSTPGSRRGSSRSRPWAGRTRPPDLARYYPNDVMMTGFDIIFFWVARMIMLGHALRGRRPVPVRCSSTASCATSTARRCRRRGATTSIPSTSWSSTAPTPLRFTLPRWPRRARTPSLGESRLLGYKAFVNKLWNASRFVLMNLEGGSAPRPTTFAALPLPSRWILSRLQDVARRGRRGPRRVPLRPGRAHASTTSSGTSSATGTSRSPSRYLAGSREAPRTRARAARGAGDDAAPAPSRHAVRDGGDLAAPAARRRRARSWSRPSRPRRRAPDAEDEADMDR